MLATFHFDTFLLSRDSQSHSYNFHVVGEPRGTKGLHFNSKRRLTLTTTYWQTKSEQKKNNNLVPYLITLR